METLGKESFLDSHNFCDEPVGTTTDASGNESNSHKIVPIYRKSEGPAKNRNKKGDKYLLDTGHRVIIVNEINRTIAEIDNALDSDLGPDRATHVFYLEDCLNKLWDVKWPRENEFIELINILYLDLKSIEYETITDTQLKAYRTILDVFLRRTVRKEDFNEALKLLNQSGINPFGLLTGEETV